MRVFLEACRMTGPLGIAVEAPGESAPGVRFLHQPFALVGRGQRADVPLEHPLVSRRHAYFQVVEGNLFWMDLESRHGIEAEGALRKSGWLAGDQRIRVGPYWIRRLPGGGFPQSPSLPSASPLLARSYGREPWPEVALEFLNGPSQSSALPVNRVISLIGSAVGCKFRLADPSVDAFHCSLARTSTGVWVVDLSEGDGVSVNNAVVRCAPLADGDVLMVGRYRIRVQVRDGARGLRARSAAAALASPDSTARRTDLAARRIAPSGIEDQRLRAELMPTTEILAAAGEEGRISESVLVPLVNQFGIMQQQMLDQFQNAMGMLVEMFGSLQREQMDLIRQELDQLREVTREFQELKVELATLSRHPGQAAAPEAGPEPTPTPAPEVAAPPPASAPEPGEAAAAAVVEPAARRAEPPRRPRADGQPTANADVMLWLNERIATLQEERESRWRRILKLLPNAS